LETTGYAKVDIYLCYELGLGRVYSRHDLKQQECGKLDHRMVTDGAEDLNKKPAVICFHERGWFRSRIVSGYSKLHKIACRKSNSPKTGPK
jgi:hypothetical protein